MLKLRCTPLNKRRRLGIFFLETEARQTIYGYIRVSTREQNENQQIIALQEADISSGQLYIDKQPGKDLMGTLERLNQ